MHKPLQLHGRNWLKSKHLAKSQRTHGKAGAYPAAVTTLQKPAMLQPAIPTWRMSPPWMLTSVISWMLRWVMKTYLRQRPHSGGSRQLRWSKQSVWWSWSHWTDHLATVCICSAGCCCTGKGSGWSEVEDSKDLSWPVADQITWKQLFKVIYLHKYFLISSYFIYQNWKMTRLSHCNMLRSSGMSCSTWAEGLRPRRLARWCQSFCFRYSVRALGLWQYG